MLSASFCAKLYGQEVSVVLSAPDSAIAGEDFEISVSIAKGEITSFAKLQLEIPPAFEVDSLESDSARYIADDSKAKYIWDRMPAKDTLHVKFKITTAQAYSGVKGINGLFAYILDETKKEIAIPTKAIKIKQPEAAAVPPEEAIAAATITEEVEADKEIIESHSEQEEADTEKELTEHFSQAEEKETKTVTKVEVSVIEEKPEPPAKTSESVVVIEFRIQIVASAYKMNIDKLKNKFNISEEIRAELHNNLWKYTVGSYATYNEAKENITTFREEKGVAGAFVTAYQNGQRITVRSAINQTK